jgi:cytochrome P450
LFFLALNSDCQKKAMEEVDFVWSEEGKEELSMDDVTDLKYVEMCWREAMRLHTPVPFVGRELSEPILLGEIPSK